MTEPTIRCDACELLFTPELREEPSEGGVVGLFTCPHCSTTFESYRVDAEGMKLRKRLREAEEAHFFLATASQDSILNLRAVAHLRERLKAHVTRGRGMLVS